MKVPRHMLRWQKTTVYVVAFLVLFLFVGSVEAASLYINPKTAAYDSGTHFTVSVMVSTNQSMNGVDAVVQFPTEKLQVISISKQHSIFNLWVQEPSFDNLGPIGTVHMQAVKLNPGFVGSDGKILDIVFKVKEVGLAEITFANGSVLANDGKGTNIISSFGSAVYTLRSGSSASPHTPPDSPNRVQAPVITHYTLGRDGKDVHFNTSADEPKWSNSAYAKFAWDTPSDATGFSALLDDKPNTDPGATPKELQSEMVFPLLSEGKRYLHVRFFSEAGPGPITHYPVLIDFHAPKYFSIEFTTTEPNNFGIYTTSNPKPFVDFFTIDDMSGIDRYEVNIGGQEWFLAENLKSKGFYRIPKMDPKTRQTITVRAFDVAGNFTDATAQIFIEPIASPVITYVPDRVVFPRQELIIEGVATPYAKVDVILEKEEPETLSTRADDTGVWRIVHSDIRESGAYTVVARQSISNEAQSDFTSPRTFYASSGVWAWWRGMNIERYLPWVEHIIIAWVVFQLFRAWRMRRVSAVAHGRAGKSNGLLSKATSYLLPAQQEPIVVVRSPIRKVSKRKPRHTKKYDQ